MFWGPEFTLELGSRIDERSGETIFLCDFSFSPRAEFVDLEKSAVAVAKTWLLVEVSWRVLGWILLMRAFASRWLVPEVPMSSVFDGAS